MEQRKPKLLLTISTKWIEFFLGPGNARSIHSENEYIEIDNLKSYSNLLMDLIKTHDKHNFFKFCINIIIKELYKYL